MKKLLWKPSRISWQIHILVAFTAVIGIVITESFPATIKQPYYQEKIKAAQIMKKSMSVLRKYRLNNIGRISKKIDPTRSGLIGRSTSSITSSTVDISWKMATINPNWAAVMVSIYKKAGLKKGDTVAVSFTGSFPAFNIAVLAAAKALKLKVIPITSIASSTWGANLPGFTWLDMESVLIKRKIFPYKSIAASLGGLRDNALGMGEKSIRSLKRAIERNNVPFIQFDDAKSNMEARMNLYSEAAGESPINAYVNVGGGTISIGSHIGKKRYKPGLNLDPPRIATRIDSIISRFAKQKIPVVNMNYSKTMAKRHGFPIEPEKMPKVGEGQIYDRTDYNKPLTAAVLAGICIMLFLFIRQGIGYRFFGGSKGNGASTPEHMV